MEVAYKVSGLAGFGVPTSQLELQIIVDGAAVNHLKLAGFSQTFEIPKAGLVKLLFHNCMANEEVGSVTFWADILADVNAVWLPVDCHSQEILDQLPRGLGNCMRVQLTPLIDPMPEVKLHTNFNEIQVNADEYYALQARIKMLELELEEAKQTSQKDFSKSYKKKPLQRKNSPPKSITRAASTLKVTKCRLDDTFTTESSQATVRSRFKDPLDQVVQREIKKAGVIGMKRLKTNVYLFRNKEIYVEVKQGKLFVKAGGGFIRFDEFTKAKS